MRNAPASLGLALCLGLLSACSGSSSAGPTAPSITAQPQSTVVNQGQAAAFSVSASGSAPLSYQWRKGGSLLAGATGSAWTIPSAQAADAGSYDVVVSNGGGSVTSSAATLGVNLPPTLTGQPQDQTVLAPAVASFSVVASGTPPLAYQWRRNGTAIAGATASTYSTLPTTAADDGAVFSVTVSNAAGSLSSGNAVLAVHSAPAITVPPQPQSVVAPARASFSVSVAGTAPLAYQWLRNGAPIAGASAASYTTPATSGADQGAAFSVVVSNAYGTATSADAGLTVNLAPTITSQPQPRSVVAPAAASFSVTATGTPVLAYQWKRNGLDLPGAVASEYTLAATTLADNGSVFSVVVTSPYGVAPSLGATLTVTGAPLAPTITVQPSSQTVLAPATASFSIVAAGTLPLSYQWKKGGSALVGATSATYTTPATAYGDGGAQFTVTVSNAAGSLTSDPATLSVNSLPIILAQPSGRTVTAPGTASFSVSATGTPPLAYQWRKNGTDIGGATSASYTTPATSTADSGSAFSVAVTNAFGTTPSANATLTVNATPGLDLSVPVVYITQATQTQAFNVPLVKDRNGYLRAFVVANQANTAAPQVRVRFYDATTSLIQTFLIPAPGASVPTSVVESSLSNSWNVAIPSSLIQPGYKLVVDVDPTSAIAEADKTNNSWPLGGTPQVLDVRTLNPFQVTFWSVQTGDSRAGNVSSGSAATFTSLLEKIWPINNATDRQFGGTFTVTDILGASATWSSVLSKLNLKRTADGVSTRYYYGVVNPNYGSGIAGMGYVGWPTAIGWDKSSGYSDSGVQSGVYAHETGHNLGLNHAPCGGPAGPDPAYPYAGGLIGVWGTDVAAAALKSPATWTDIMGYCSTVWVSDYNYKIVLANRQGGGVPIVVSGPPEQAATPRTLVLWGRLAQGVPVLEPAFHLAVDALPPAPGDHILEGLDSEGRRLFAVPFGLLEVGCGGDGSDQHFSFSIPLSATDAGRLAEFRWLKADDRLARQGGPARGSRPGWEPVTQALTDGRVRLLWDASVHPAVLVRDRATGLVIGLGDGGDFRFGTEADELEFHFSDGVRSSATVVRRPRLEN